MTGRETAMVRWWYCNSAVRIEWFERRIDADERYESLRLGGFDVQLWVMEHYCYSSDSAKGGDYHA